MLSAKLIDKKGLCIGCGICNSIDQNKPINFLLGKDGAYHPDSETTIKNLKNICPGVFIENVNIIENEDQLFWGYYKECYEAYSLDDEIRFFGSSGGTITALSYYLIEHKIVTGIIHLGNTENPLFYKLRISKTKEELLRNAGSKYITTDYLKGLRNILKESEGVLAFVGKPCDISAVKQYLKYTKEFEGKILLYISFFCAGLPKFTGLNKIFTRFGLKEESIKHIKYRGEGWPGNFKIITNDDKEYRLSYDDSWGKYLGRELHFRCKICPDGVGMLADIACCDAWDIVDGKPDFSEKPGKSVIFARSQMGLKIIKETVENKYITINKYDVSKLKIIQNYQYQRHSLILSRIFAFTLICNIFPKFKKFGLVKAAKKTSIVIQIRNFIGIFKRIKK